MSGRDSSWAEPLRTPNARAQPAQAGFVKASPAVLTPGGRAGTNAAGLPRQSASQPGFHQWARCALARRPRVALLARLWHPGAPPRRPTHHSSPPSATARGLVRPPRSLPRTLPRLLFLPLSRERGVHVQSLASRAANPANTLDRQPVSAHNRSCTEQFAYSGNTVGGAAAVARSDQAAGTVAARPVVVRLAEEGSP